MDLPLWPRGCLYEALSSYLRSQIEYLSEATIRDYRDRERWLCGIFGESSPLKAITFSRLEEVFAKHGPHGKGLMGTTVKRRFVHLLAAMKYAAARGIISRDDVPQMPRIRNDGRAGTRVLSVGEFNKLRLALSLSDRYRLFAELSFYTGQHSSDIFSMERWMLEPDFEWKNESGDVVSIGRFWRRNTKNRRCVSCWWPMESELRELATAMLKCPGDKNDKIVGRLWSLSKAFSAASDRCEIQRVRPSQDLRRSYASLLLARGRSEEFVRQALGHEGGCAASPDGGYLGALKPTIGTRHYYRTTDDMLLREMQKK